MIPGIVAGGTFTPPEPVEEEMVFPSISSDWTLLEFV